MAKHYADMKSMRRDSSPHICRRRGRRSAERAAQLGRGGGGGAGGEHTGAATPPAQQGGGTGGGRPPPRQRGGGSGDRSLYEQRQRGLASNGTLNRPNPLLDPSIESGGGAPRGVSPAGRTVAMEAAAGLMQVPRGAGRTDGAGRVGASRYTPADYGSLDA